MKADVRLWWVLRGELSCKEEEWGEQMPRPGHKEVWSFLFLLFFNFEEFRTYVHWEGKQETEGKRERCWKASEEAPGNRTRNMESRVGAPTEPNGRGGGESKVATGRADIPLDRPVS